MNARDNKYGKLHQSHKPTGATTTIEVNGTKYRVPLAAASKVRAKLVDAQRGYARGCKRSPEESVPNQWAGRPYRWEDKR